MRSLFEAISPKVIEKLAVDLSKLDCYLSYDAAIDMWCKKYGIKGKKIANENPTFICTQPNPPQNIIGVILKKYGFDDISNKTGFSIHAKNSSGDEIVIELDDMKIESDRIESLNGIKLLDPVFLFSMYFHNPSMGDYEVKGNNVLILQKLLEVIRNAGLRIELIKYLTGKSAQNMKSLFEAFAGNNNIAVVLSKLGCYLYGDNAIDEWCDKVGVNKGRKRQTDTIEFYNPYDNKSNNKNIEEVLKDEGFTVDASSIEIFGERKDINIAVLTGYEKNSKMYTSIKNLKIMHPAVLFVEI